MIRSGCKGTTYNYTLLFYLSHLFYVFVSSGKGCELIDKTKQAVRKGGTACSRGRNCQFLPFDWQAPRLRLASSSPSIGKFLAFDWQVPRITTLFCFDTKTKKTLVCANLKTKEPPPLMCGEGSFRFPSLGERVGVGFILQQSFCH